MRVTIRDESVLRAVQPREIITYLRSRGFREDEKQAATGLWRRGEGAGEVEVLVPMEPGYRDFASRVLDVLRALELVEERSQLDILRDLRASTAEPEFELRGYVSHLDRHASATEGTVTIRGFVDGRLRAVELSLGEPQYGLAVRAHAERLSVFCIGELRRRGPSFVLENPRQLAVEGAGA